MNKVTNKSEEQSSLDKNKRLQYSRVNKRKLSQPMSIVLRQEKLSNISGNQFKNKPIFYNKSLVRAMDRAINLCEGGKSIEQAPFKHEIFSKNGTRNYKPYQSSHKGGFTKTSGMRGQNSLLNISKDLSKLGGSYNNKNMNISAIIEEPQDIAKDIKVFYSTNRVIDEGEALFSGRTDHKCIHYGIAYISVPKGDKHKRGRIERPISFFSEKIGKHFVIKSGKTFQEKSFFSAIDKESPNKRLLVFIHGFNVSFKKALMQAAQIKVDLAFTDPILLFSWPSNGKLFSYSHDKESAIESSDALSTILSKVAQLEFNEVFVIAHSMGAFCLAESLKNSDIKLAKNSRLALAAPDIKKGVFESRYSKRIMSHFKETSIYVSSRDLALFASRWKNKSYRLGDTNGYIEVISDIDTIDMSKSSKKFFTLHHSYPFDNQNARMDLMYFLINGIKAPNRGLDRLENKFKKFFWGLPTHI